MILFADRNRMSLYMMQTEVELPVMFFRRDKFLAPGPFYMYDIRKHPANPKPANFSKDLR